MLMLRYDPACKLRREGWSQRWIAVPVFPEQGGYPLQSEEWRQTTELLRGVFEDVRRPRFERLHILVHAFIRSECEEAGIRVALNNAVPLYRNAPEAQEARASGARLVQVFMQERWPKPLKRRAHWPVT
jgi:hypothetical protein